MRVFSQVARADGKISKRGFDQAVTIFQGVVSLKVMAKIGLSTATLANLFLLLVWVLLMMFIFIFMGISGFANTNQFTAVINSLLPLAGALGLSRGGASEESKVLREKAQVMIRTVLDMMKKIT
jgi:hypothetical protein